MDSFNLIRKRMVRNSLLILIGKGLGIKGLGIKGLGIKGLWIKGLWIKGLWVKGCGFTFFKGYDKLTRVISNP